MRQAIAPMEIREVGDGPIQQHGDAVTCARWSGGGSRPGSGAPVGLAHAGLDLVRTRGWIRVSAGLPRPHMRVSRPEVKRSSRSLAQA
jgi:hypothetical protein